ncbi:MAG: ComEA family DNA-binding protein [Lachnospiraceae bacterium]|nr:ComEA family DNA-binding protein [Lachnospiraceae bacterium]
MDMPSEDEATVPETPAIAETDPEPAEKEDKYIYVFLCGAVQNPGVYELPEGSRLFELLERAGGMRGDAAADALNQAEILSDGKQIRIPTVDEINASAATGDSQAGAFAPSHQDGRININTASLSDLMTINGIGETRAQAIIDYREEHGSFATIEDIKLVNGIKDGLFNKIKDQITV